MLAGLARWLRAAGYDAAYTPNVADRDLVERAKKEQRILLTSDTHLGERRVVREGRVPWLLLPRNLSNERALAIVLGEFRLPLLDSRCMKCGGALVQVAREDVKEEVPPRTYERCRMFFRCTGCGRLLWQGSHWDRIMRTLQNAAARARE